jgi:D-alanyl-lipoteichoic acid acyltransferase DltB (MBOAT superfamily)
MVVNSFVFLWFFLFVMVVYYLFQTKKDVQNVFLLACSYWFYSQVDIKMTILLVILTLVFWLIGKGIHHFMEQENERKAGLMTSFGVIIGIGALFYFKYLNFFAESFASFASFLGFHVSWTALHLVVPIGLSFFTFKLMSYVLDIHHGKLPPPSPTDSSPRAGGQLNGFICFANYIAFFPTILSGPIDRPKPFLTQANIARRFNPDLLMTGFQRILWGMFLKMCIADRLDIYVSAVWNNYEHHSAISILFASLLYPLQMYADFGGYSEMAIGVALMLGFKVAENFKRPFFVLDIAGYWSRWHMTLTSWLTDYVFLPLNIKFRDWGVYGTIFAIMLNMTFIGLWHGANWTFLLFGIYHGLWYIPLMVGGGFFKKRKIKVNAHGWPKLQYVWKMIGIYLVVTFGLMLFHSATISEFWYICERIATHWQGGLFTDLSAMVNGAICLIVLIYVDIQEEWFPKYQLPLPRLINRWRWELTIAVEIVAILLFGVFDNNQFIYFQF